MALFAQARLDLLRRVVEPEHGAPSRDTFSRVFRMIAPEPFEAAFTTAFGGALQGVVAIDGKGRRAAPARTGTGRSRPTGADYALALISTADPATRAVQLPVTEHDHHESRSAVVMAADDIDFPGIAAVAMIESYRLALNLLGQHPDKGPSRARSSEPDETTPSACHMR